MRHVSDHKKIYLVGMMGSGKSYWAGRLGHHFGWPAYDMDYLIEKAAGKTIRQIFETEGEEAFRKLEADMLTNGVPGNQFVLATGGGTPCFFDNMSFMKNNGIVIWLKPPVAELVKRLRKGIETRPVLSGITSTEALSNHLENLLAVRTGWYLQADIVVEEELPQLDVFIKKITALESGSLNFQE